MKIKKLNKLFVSLLIINIFLINSKTNNNNNKVDKINKAKIKSIAYKLDIIKIKNLSKNHIRVNSGKANKTILYNNHVIDHKLNIPFISVNDYIIEYITEKPFIPQKALKIETKKGSFGLWENEQGIMCSPDIKSSRGEIIPKCIMEAFNTKLNKTKLKTIVPLMLIVDNNGKPNLARLNAKA